MASPFPPRREGVETLADVEWPREGTPHMADVQFNPMDPAFVEDPYPTYHVLRREDPVHHSPLGFWVLTRYADVIASLRDPRLIKEPIAAFVAARFGMAVPPGLGLSMLDRDPPDHTRLRGLVSKAFTPKALESLRPRIQQIAGGLDAIMLPPDSEVGKRSVSGRRALAEYFRALIAERRAAPRDDMLSAL